MRALLLVLVTGCSVGIGQQEPSSAEQGAIQLAQEWQHNQAVAEAAERAEPALQEQRRAELAELQPGPAEPVGDAPVSTYSDRPTTHYAPEPRRMQLEPRRLLCRDGTVSACECGGPRATCCMHHGGVLECE